MQHSPRFDVTPNMEDQHEESLDAVEMSQERLTTVWVSRVTSVVGGICLLCGLALWLVRPEHYRLVLVLLTIARFAAILNSYTFENGHRS